MLVLVVEIEDQIDIADGSRCKTSNWKRLRPVLTVSMTALAYSTGASPPRDAICWLNIATVPAGAAAQKRVNKP